MDDDFTEYETLKRTGKTAEEACLYALDQDKGTFFQVRMLGSVYGLGINDAGDTAIRAFQAKVRRSK